MQKPPPSTQKLAASITRAASRQTYYTVRYLVDRQRVADAYRAYAYFRWIDDRVDSDAVDKSEAIVFMNRQKALMNSCYQGKQPPDLATEEEILADLILADQEKNSGLQLYIRNMMAAIDFDARRSGRLLSRLELSQYTQSLAIAVTEVLHHFIGHDQPAPLSSARYQAATGAHIAHMLRDTVEDIQVGFFNIARFEVVLDAIERMDYRLAPEYVEGRGLGAKMRTRGLVLALAFLPGTRK